VANVRVIWDPSAAKVLAERNPRIQRGLLTVAGRLVVAMKRAAPVSKVQRVYANPVPMGTSTGKGGYPRTRYQGDLPLRPSGYLRNSIRAFVMPDGSVIVGPTASYGRFVNEGTPPHVIRSTGPWPLRNRATGQVFGPVVNHPGTAPSYFVQRAVMTLRGVVVKA
jgi:hypothetical protein